MANEYFGPSTVEELATEFDVSPDNHPMDDIQVQFTKGDHDAIMEIRNTLRELKTALENFDPSTLMASILGGGGNSSPMGAILGSFVKQP